MYRIKRFNESVLPTFDLEFYNVTIETDTTTDNLYFGIHYDDAKKTFENAECPSNFIHWSNVSVLLTKATVKYEFIYVLDEDESIDDYPIDDYYEDNYYYKRLTDFEFGEPILYRTFEPVNKESDVLLDLVYSHYKKMYNGGKYSTITVHDSDGNIIGTIQLRITNHSENVLNNDRYNKCDYYISVVIADLDSTENKFSVSKYERRRNERELKFTSENNFDEIIEEIDFIIDEFKTEIEENND